MKTKLLNALVIALLLFQAVAPIGALAYTGTDQPDYAPGATVTISGDNSDEAGYAAGETVLVEVAGPSDFAASCEAVANESGAWWCQLTLPADVAAGSYTYVATGRTSLVSQSGGFTVTAPEAPTTEPTQEPTAEPTASPTVEPIATAPAVLSPFIVSDKEDYAPGELVTLNSGNWQLGESVHLIVNDVIGNSWVLATDVLADNSGAFVYQFNLPTWFVAQYHVYAYGAISGAATTDFTDADPTITTPTVSSEPSNEGSAVTASATYNQFSGGGLPTCTVNYGDGSGNLNGTASGNNNGTCTGPSHAYADNGSFTVTVTVTKGSTVSSSTTHVVNNVAPTATFAATSPIVVNNSSTLSLTSPVDPGADNLRYSFACNGLDTSLASTFVSAGLSTSANCVFGTTGDFTVKGRILDEDNAFTTYSATVVVRRTTTTSVACSPNPDVLNNPTTCTVQVKDTTTGAVAPTGSVSFSSSGTGTFSSAFTPANSCILSGSGNQTSCSVTYTPTSAGTGTHTITASYGGDSSHFISSGNTPVSVTSQQATSLSVSAASGMYGGTTTLSATLTSGGNGVNGKTINFSLNGNSVGSATTNASGVATLSNASLSGINAGTYAAGVSASFASDGSYSASSNTAQLTVNKAALTVTAANKSKTYGDADPAFTFSYSGFVNSETSSVIDTVPTCGVSGAHSNFGTYSIVCSGGTDNNYSFTYVDGTLTVATRAITVTADAKSKVYGAADPALTYQVTSGSLINGDSFSGSLSRAAGGNVGTYAINQGSLTAGGNYAITFVGANLSITARPITVTADPQTKVYGNADPAFTYSITSGSLVTGDSFSGSLSRVAGENVGTYAINQGSLSAGSNYNITFVGANLSITERAVAVKADNKSKTYGNADPALTYQITTGSLAFSDTFGGSLSRDVGESVGSYDINQGTLSLSSNYNLSFTKGTLTIGTRAVEVTADAQSKVYGDADPALTYQITSGSLAAGDNFTGTLARETGEDVGSYAINQGDLALNGNYVLSFVGADLSITARPITVTADAQSITYGDADPALTYQITSGSLVTGDSLSGSLVRVVGENVGSYAIQQGSLTAGDNYDLTYVGANLSIAQRPITVTAAAKTKVYGNADPALTFSITSGSLAFSDAFTGALTRDAGEDVDDYAITQGTLALNSNYDLTFVGANLTITKRAVTVTADDKSKTYGNADPALTYQITSGSLAAGDAFTGSLAREAGENVGSYDITQGTLALSDNYDLNFVEGTLSIGLRAVTVTADAKTKVYGDADPALTYEITSGSLAAGDAFTGSISRDAGEDVDDYAITQGTLALDSNYALTFVGANLSITKRPVTVTADAQTKVYGHADPAFTYQVTIGNVISGDAFAGALTRAAGEDVGDYAIGQGSLTLGDNYNLSFIGNDLTITKRPVTVTADAKTKVYGNSDPALTYQITSGSLAFSDAFSGALTRAAGESVGTYAITQGDLALSGNYSLTFVGANFSITVRPVTVTADAKNKVYGNADPALTYFITSGSLAFTDAFIGALTRDPGEDVDEYAITQGTLALSNNYALTYVGANLSVSVRPITVTAVAKTKVYGETDPALTYQIADGSLAFSDAFSGALTRVTGEDVGSYAIQQGTLALSNNYDLTYVGANLSITKRPVTVTADAQTKVYGQSDPALTYQITSGTLAFSDTFSGALAREAGNNVGTYAIKQGTLTLGGNYNLSYIGANLSITPATLTVVADPQTKVYGEPDPALTYAASGFQFSDNEATVLTGSLAREIGQNVGSYDIVQGTLVANGNYTIDFTGDTLEITQRPVTVKADAQTKVYGEADPSLTYQITSGSLAFSDTFSGALSRDAGQNVGTYAISQGTLTLGGNYDLTFTGANLTITVRPVTVTADAKTKVYGNADPSLTYQITSGSLGFTDTFSGGLTRAAGENVGTYAITKGTLALSSNYDLTFIGANFSITVRLVTVTADAKTKVYSDADPALTYQITSGSLAFSDAFTGALNRDAGENVGDYAIKQNTLALSSNYALTYVGANLSITKAELTVKADNKSIYFGNPDPIFSFTYAGFKFGENATVIDTAPTCGVSVAHTVVGSYPITCSGGLDNNYSFKYVDGTLTVGKWTLNGFYAPVDMSPSAPTTIVWNTVKNGSTVPFKFQILVGSTEVIDTSKINLLPATKISCTTGTEDAVEELASTGGTSLRYDSTAHQFIYNWQTPKSINTCYRVTIGTADGSSLIAYFKLK